MNQQNDWVSAFRAHSDYTGQNIDLDSQKFAKVMLAIEEFEDPDISDQDRDWVRCYLALIEEDFCELFFDCNYHRLYGKDEMMVPYLFLVH